MPAIQWLAYNFPNRHSDKTVVEVRVKFEPAETFEQNELPQLIGRLLLSSGILSEDEPFPEFALPEDQVACYASLLMQLALLFQRNSRTSGQFLLGISFRRGKSRYRPCRASALRCWSDSRQVGR